MSESINIEFTVVAADFWRYNFGTWTHHSRLEGETDEQLLARIRAETEHKFSHADLHPTAPSWDAVNLPSQEPS